ncbi:MAG: hypothetical protein LLG20_18670 [Acidobacteriales bacterium]|nr:hypothetical protein [Terriglobales bacterium]
MRAECNRHVQCYFSAEEKAEFARQLARNTQDLEALNDRKAQVTSEFTAKIKAATAEIFKVARLMNNGYEYRDVKCDVLYDTPKRGYKRIIRMDTGEVVEDCPMSPDELQQSLDFAVEAAVESANGAAPETEEPKAETEPEPEVQREMVPEPEVEESEPDPFADTLTPAEMPAPLSEPVRIVGSGNDWHAEIVILETAAGFQAEVSMQIGSSDQVPVDGGTIFASESEAREDAAKRLYGYAQTCYAEASGKPKRAIHGLMAWAAEYVPRSKKEE